jgi:hypothetical protein
MEIVITGSSMSVEDTRKANAVPADELPRLTDGQKEFAKKFNMSEEASARSLLASQYGEARLHASATKLGQVLEEHLPKLVQGIEIEKLIYEVCLENHKLWLRYRGRNHVVQLPQADVDDWLASGKPEDFQQLCKAIARELPQE